LSNTNITNVQISDTFQVWLTKTNELVDLVNENVMLAGPGAGFTVAGNSTLTGTFTANTILSEHTSTEDLSVNVIEHKDDINDQIISNSPIRIDSSVSNIFDLKTSAGQKPIFRLINGGNARWSIKTSTASASAGLDISLEGSTTPQVSISQAGKVTANSFQGDGSELTGIDAGSITSGQFSSDRIGAIDASKITTGILDGARIGDIDASKITTGVLGTDRIPNLNANKITSGVLSSARIGNLDASKIATGTLNEARIPNLNASIITSGLLDEIVIPSSIVRTSRAINTGAGLQGGGSLTSDLSISIREATVQETLDGIRSDRVITPRRLKIAFWPVNSVYVQYPGTDSPSDLFGGSWVRMFNTEGAFFRTEGGGANSFEGDLQSDQMQRLTGGIGSGTSAAAWNNSSFANPRGVFSTSTRVTSTIGASGNRGGWRLGFDSRRSTGARTSTSTSGETRPLNRTIRIWRRTD